MDRHIQTNHFRGMSARRWSACVVTAAVAVLGMLSPVGAEAKFNLSRASGKGVFNIGPSKGMLVSASDSTRPSAVRLTYEAPANTYVGVWTKGYPADVKADVVNVIKAYAKFDKPEQAQEISVALEVKGDKDVQRVTLPLQAGWGATDSLIDWDRVGKLREVVFVVSPMGGARKGVLFLDLEFVKADIAPRKVSGVISATQAGARGIFNIKAAQGMLNPFIDPDLKKEIFRFDYSAQPNSFVGIWTKGYPSELTPKSFNGLKVAVKGSKGQASEVNLVLEVKGTKEVQRIPVPLLTSWKPSPHLVDWNFIGDLREVVLVLSPNGGARKGTVYFDFSFVNLKGAKPARAGTFTLSDARAKGGFNTGPAQMTVGSYFDEKMGKEVTTMDLSAPAKSIVGLWSKDYPTTLNADTINGVTASIRVPKESLGQITAALEIKGTNKDIQRAPFLLEAGWNTIKEPIDWTLIGNLREVVFVVVPNQKLEKVETSVAFDLEFAKGKFERTLPPAPAYPDLTTHPDVVSANLVHNMSKAGAMGVFNIKDSEGMTYKAADPVSKKEVTRFDYRCPPGSVVGIWTKDYPATLSRDSVNAIRASVYISTPAQAGEIAVSLEMKGDKVQNIPLTLQEGWNIFHLPLNWTAIGTLKEAVFVLSPKGGGERKGTIFVDLDFIQAVFTEKPKGPSGAQKALWVLLGALGLSGLGALAQKAGRGSKNPGSSAGSGSQPETAFAKLRYDIFTGLAVALLVGVAGAIYALGTVEFQSPLAAGIVGLLGVLVAELFKVTRLKTHLTPFEIFQNFFLTGVLWAVSSAQVLWQIPTEWTHVLLKNNMVMALACLVYHFTNATRMSSTQRHLRFISGALIVGTPFLFGLLLVLQTPILLQQAGTLLVLGSKSAPWVVEILGRFALLFVFNELAANAIGLVTKGTLLKNGKGHGWIALVSAAVVVSPYIADLGCGPKVASLPTVAGALVALVSSMLAQGGLWMEAYLVTGLILDGIYGYAPTEGAISRHSVLGLRKGMAYSFLFLGLLYGLKGLIHLDVSKSLMTAFPWITGAVAGALLYPLVKTIIETFDGSMGFFLRARYSYRHWPLYLRGAAVGGAFAFGLQSGLPQLITQDRLLFGLVAGIIASGGMSVLRDFLNSLRKQGHIQSIRVYGIESIAGGAIGALIAFYLDTAQVTALVNKFMAYTSIGLPKTDFSVYSFVSKWGRIDLGAHTGGVKLFYDEALAGLITWSIAAPLFAINKVFMVAYFHRDKSPITFFFSKAGAQELTVNLIHVMRWGLWMSPIINSGIRMMAQATWYNQDGAIRSIWAIFQNLTMNPADFQAWSLGVFISLLAYDLVRVLIWMDHMGLRVATLVNLSFIGMDRLDEKIARFIGPSAAQRFLPEGVKRFTTWAPLLIPFYIPRGADWDVAWTKSQEIISASAEAVGLPQKLAALGGQEIAGLGVIIFVLAVLASVGIRSWLNRLSRRRPAAMELANREYRVVVQSDGAAYSYVAAKGYDVSRRSYDIIDPAGRALFVVDTAQAPGQKGRAWPVLGNAPTNLFAPSRYERGDGSIRVINETNGLRVTLEIKLLDDTSTAEKWTVTVENLTGASRDVKVVPYLEWVLDRFESDRGHTQYERLFPEMEYVQGANAVLAWQKKTKTMGFIASNVGPEGFHTSRMDFIGRARSLWTSRLLETLAFHRAQETRPYPTFDPIGTLLMGLRVDANASRSVQFLVGFAKNRESALATIQSLLKPVAGNPGAAQPPAKKVGPLVGHGEILPGTPLPYYEYKDGGNTLVVKTPFTPRPYDHALSNNGGHYVLVTNRGLHTTSNGNSQQNPITVDWADTVTREVPSEAIYLYDTQSQEWFSPTHHPLNDLEAKNECAFSVDGTARFTMSKGTLSTELTVYVPPADTTTVCLLTIKNNGSQPRRMRVAPYFQIAMVPPWETRRPAIQFVKDPSLNAVFFENPVNSFRVGPAFAAMSIPAEKMETRRGRFMGQGRGVARPYLVEKGQPDTTPSWDDRSIVGLLGSVEVPAHGEKTVVVLLGQTDTQKMGADIIRKFNTVEGARKGLEDTRRWWTGLTSTVKAKTNQPEFDGYFNWLKYQAVAERIWARRGFYQTSGAYGFRDQLQDSVNLIWVDPALARKQILLHASQQFVEGDVVHWFHTLHDGRTAFSNRSHASDNPLWLAWGAAEYVRMTGDYSLLDERTSYLKGENPFLSLPKNKHGWGMIYLRSALEDTVYRHCMKSIDLVLEKRMGKNGLPLIGTGDWNDGLDEIGSEGRGESVWLGFFLHYILRNMADIIEKKDGRERKDYYLKRLSALEAALEKTWREDRYLRAIHDDGTEIGVKDSGVWEIDALTAAWAVYAGINPERNKIVFQTALRVLEKDNVILLGWPALREDTKPYLGRSSQYPEGVRENGMYCHGVQWMVRAARLLAERADQDKEPARAKEYRETAYRLWMKISPLSHMSPTEIELYGGQPNKQSADMLSTYDPGRMIWHGYTGAAGWMLRQGFEGVIGAQLLKNEVVLPADLALPRGPLTVSGVYRDLSGSPVGGSARGGQLAPSVKPKEDPVPVGA
jgi:cyclic beta-1,2-glucan synthetase